ncbi:MAG: hypothetical protein QM845_10605, partial [Verrucomicrobiota bacterium]|nr:hypothetical protein [Verrucomicrobiota bacterium]
MHLRLLEGFVNSFPVSQIPLQGYEMFPRFSPDGKWIAFTGHYDGNTEVYVMPSEGGVPRRLT